MNKFYNVLIVLLTSSMFSNSVSAQDVEEIVVTSALIDTTEITNPLYVIDGDEIVNDATTSLGDAIDGYLGISMAD